MAADRPSDHFGSRRIDTGRITLNVREAGDGPLMLFFHGITSNSAVFAPLMARLSDRFTTIAVDQRGHGLSDKPESGYDAHDYAEDIAGLIRTLDRGRAILVGHSLGARNSVTAAARYPDLVRSVIAIDFTPYIETEVVRRTGSPGERGRPALQGRGGRRSIPRQPLSEHSRRRHQDQGRKRHIRRSMAGCVHWLRRRPWLRPRKACDQTWCPLIGT